MKAKGGFASLSFPQTAAAEFPAVSSTAIDSFLARAWSGWQIQIGVAPGGARLAHAYPRRYPEPKTRWNSAEFGGRQKRPLAHELADL